MGVETATYVGDLTPTTPGSADLINQGDDHLRLIKQVLQNTFPVAEKAFNFPSTAQQSASFSVAATDANKTFFVTTTSGAVTMTLPSTLGTGDAGWECYMMKASADVNPVLVTPPTGTITSGQIPGLVCARRCIPFTRVPIYWTGSSFLVGRSTSAGPVGSCIEYHGSTLPFGYEFPNGQTLASASTAYPEYSAVIGSGVTLDKRGRVGIVLDNLGGSAAGRIGTIITGTAVGNVGGTETVTLSAGQIPTITFSGSGSFSGSTSAALSGTIQALNNGTFSGGVFEGIQNGTGSFGGLSCSGGVSVSGSSANTGGGSHSNLQPSIMVSQLLVVE